MMSSETKGQDKRTSGSTHDEDGTKSRTRVSRACTRCRTRKDRCDGLRPSCTACSNAHQTCCYEPSTKKRGLPEGYVRGLEKLIALLMGKIKGFEAVTSSLLKDNREILSKIWNHAGIGEELHSIWKDSSIATELESLLSSLDQSSQSTSHKRKRDRDDDGSHDDPEFDTSFHITSEYHFSRLTASTEIPSMSAVASEDVPKFPQQALQLLDQYFAHTNCWFPILRRPDLTRACYEMARGHTTSFNQNMSPLLWAVFAYAVKQHKPSEYILHGDISSEDMYRLSLSLLPTKAEDCTLVHAQALLVLSLIDIGHDLWKSAWVLIGKAVRIVLMSPFDTKQPDKGFIATMHGCFILDIAVAAHLRCIPHLRKHDIATLPRMAEDGHEEWEPWNGLDGFRGHREPSFSLSCFNRLTEISSIVSEVLSLQSQAQAIGRNQVQSLLTRLHDLQSMFPGQMPPSSHSPPHQIYLQLSHVSAQMLLVELPVDTGARSHERAKLACNVLSLLGLCKNAPAITLAYLPPFCYDGLAAASRLANTSRKSFGPAQGLPSFSDFTQTSNEYITELSSIWPLFRKLNDQDHVATKSQTESLDFANEDRPVHQTLDGNNPDVNRGSYGTGQQDMTDIEGVNLWMLSGDEADHVIGDFKNGPAHAPQNTTSSNRMFDKYIGSNAAPGPIDVGAVDASPSFHGDEIDAIFHEMAHLDTNDWTNDRVTGLKDFGFDDDLTFQAFCNDPDRIAGPEDNGRTLSSNLQSWMFTNDPG